MSVGVSRFAPAVLQAARSSAGLSRDALAVLVGVSGSAVGMWETGRAAPSPTHLVLLASELDLEPDDLIRIPRPEATLSGLRERAGFSSAEVARAMRLSASKYSRIERGLDQPTDSQVELLAQLCGIAESDVDEAWLRAREESTRRRR